MAVPVFCCGFECGVSHSDSHCNLSADASFSTSTIRSGARSLRINSAGTSNNTATVKAIVTSNMWVGRFYIRFATLPSVDCKLFYPNANGSGVYFKQSDSKIYAGASTANLGATGVSVTTDVWYRIDVRQNMSANPHLIDVQVDGVACGQASNPVAAITPSTFFLGPFATMTLDVFFDDLLLSNTSGDYPLGAGYINHFIPTSDGTHNVAGAADFRRSATATDILNSTTTAYQLIDDVPLKSGVVAEYINLIAPPNATDYVEIVFGPAPGISTPTVAPIGVETIVAHASAATGTHNLRIAVNDNGTVNDMLNTIVAPGTTATYGRKHYADPPSAATVWTLSGNGNFNNVRMRCYTSDAAPDPWWASAMIEAEFQGDPPVSTYNNNLLLTLGVG